MVKLYNPNEMALNLCDFLGRTNENENVSVEQMINKFNSKDFSKIYMGAYYCDHYFLYTHKSKYISVIDYAKREKKKIALVIPPVFENNLNNVIKLAYNLIERGRDVIDEVTINDWGMIEFFQNNHGIKLNMGRLLQKDNRDPRYREFFENTHVHRCFSKYYEQLLTTKGFYGLELDCTNKSIMIPDTISQIKIAVHGPWAYMTMGSICVYSATSKKNNKFRFADKCSCECDKAIVKIKCEDDLYLYRFGRSIQFNNEECNIIAKKPYRYIYSPFNEIMRGI